MKILKKRKSNKFGGKENMNKKNRYLQEKIKGLASENDTLLNTNEDLKKVLNERDETTKKLGQQLAGKEEHIQKIGAGSHQALEEQEKVLSEKDDLLKYKEDALMLKEKQVFKLEKDLEAQNLENEKITKYMNDLRVIIRNLEWKIMNFCEQKEKEEDHQKIEKLNGEVEALKKKFEEALEEKKKATEALIASQEKQKEEEEIKPEDEGKAEVEGKIEEGEGEVKPEEKEEDAKEAPKQEEHEEKAHKNEDEPEMKRKHGE